MDRLKRRTQFLWEIGFNDMDIVNNLEQFYDTNAYRLAYEYPLCASYTQLNMLV